MENIKLNLTGGNNKKNRRELDYYPTPYDCTIALMDFLKIEGKYLLEPCCGCGQISRVLEAYKNLVLSTDIRTSTGYGRGGVDYLHNKFYGYDAIITNPPFNLASEFVVKAVSESPVVAFLLKSQFWHSQKRYDLFKKHRPAYILPLTWRPNFAPERGNSPTMEVLWTVWKTGSETCEYIPLERPEKTHNILSVLQNKNQIIF